MASTSDEDIIELTDIIELGDAIEYEKQGDTLVEKKTSSKNAKSSQHDDLDNDINDDINAILSQMEDDADDDFLDDDDDFSTPPFNANETITMPDMSEVNNLLNDLNIPSQNNNADGHSTAENDDTLDDILDDLLGAGPAKNTTEHKIINDDDVDLSEIIGDFNSSDGDSFFNLDNSPTKNQKKSAKEEDKTKPKNINNLDTLLNESAPFDIVDDEDTPENNLESIVAGKKLTDDDIDNIDDILDLPEPEIDADDMDYDALLNELPHDADDKLDLNDVATAQQEDDELLSSLLNGSIDDDLDSILDMAEAEVAPGNLHALTSPNLDEEPSEDFKDFDAELSDIDESMAEADQKQNVAEKNASIKPDNNSNPIDIPISNIPPILPDQSNKKIKQLEDNIQTLEEKLGELSQSHAELQERCTALADKVVSLEEEFSKNVEKAAASAAAKIIREEIAKLLA